MDRELTAVEWKDVVMLMAWTLFPAAALVLVVL